MLPLPGKSQPLHRTHGGMTVTSFFADTPLKHMDGAALALAIQEAFPSDSVRRALAAASFLHRNQTRASRASLPRTAYIDHPLRGALRVIRWGVTNEDIIVAIILHDTAEDCAAEIASVFKARPDATPSRPAALPWRGSLTSGALKSPASSAHCRTLSAATRS